MSLDEKAIAEASRQLTALEGGVREVLLEATSGTMCAEMITVKESILASLWQDETAIASAKRIAGKTEQEATVVEDALIVSIALDKLDDETSERITRRLDPQGIPTWKELRDELDRRANQMYYAPKKKKL
uniref:Uncharacterized protein n=1 Tax=Anopheles culicifacies TaxID=139723 RepID=A0A182LYZ2_9DIPT